MCKMGKSAAILMLLFAVLIKTLYSLPVEQENFEKCSSEEGAVNMLNCVSIRLLNSIDSLERQPKLEILPGISFISNKTTTRAAKSLKIEQLPEDPQEKASKLLDLLLESTSRFLSERSLKINLPQGNIARALEEGRGKMKKMMGPLMLGLGAKMLTMVPIMMSGLALLAAKALMIGKLAMVISVILFVQYFFAGRGTITPFNGGGYTPYGYGTYGGGGSFAGAGGYGGTNNLGGWGYSQQYPYARSIDLAAEEDIADSKTGQDLAYSGHKE